MIIQFAGTSKGWGNYVINRATTSWGDYVLNGTKKKPRDHNKIKVLKGDIEFGDRITNTTSYKQNAYSIVIGFKGKPDNKTIESALDDFEKMFMYGFSRDEYHIDAVLHQDTDNYHVHVRIPKLNLKTGTQLQLYIDKQDRKRVNLIRDFIDIKYNLESPLNNTKLIKEQHKEKDFDLSKPKARQQSELAINDYICELHQAGFINNLDDIKNILKETGLNVHKLGHDFAKDFHYITVSNGSGKIRLKGDLYNAEFWNNSRENRAKQISTNQQHRGINSRTQSEYDRIQDNLRKELNKRYTAVKKRYKSARARADKKLEQLKQKNQESSIREGETLKQQRTKFVQFNQNISSNNDTNIDASELPHIQAISTKQIECTKTIHNKTKERKIYSYTSKRIELYKEQSKSLYKNRRLSVERDDRDTTNQNSDTRAERTSPYNSFNPKRESLYREVRETMQRNTATRTNRERYREALNNIGTRYKTIRKQYNAFIKSTNGFIQDVKEFIINKKLNTIQKRETKNYALEKHSEIESTRNQMTM
ncbi:MAG: hypothetical protein ACJAWW_001563 [Sulfurimonas sp.]|jgi:hypothetical protein